MLCVAATEMWDWNMSDLYLEGSEYHAAWAFHYGKLAFLIPLCISTCSEEPVELRLNKDHTII